MLQALARITFFSEIHYNRDVSTYFLNCKIYIYDRADLTDGGDKAAVQPRGGAGGGRCTDHTPAERARYVLESEGRQAGTLKMTVTHACFFSGV